jgi:hypothetical protein
LSEAPNWSIIAIPGYPRNNLSLVVKKDGVPSRLSPAQVVAISPVMAFSVMIVLIAWTRRYMLALRERRLREQAAEAQRP